MARERLINMIFLSTHLGFEEFDLVRATSSGIIEPTACTSTERGRGIPPMGLNQAITSHVEIQTDGFF